MIKVVARYLNGQVVKGFTTDFSPFKDRFHLVPEGRPGLQPLDVSLSELKGLFFVKDFRGDRRHVKSNAFHPGHVQPGKRIQIRFKDGELLLGVTQGFQPNRPGFFVLPADPAGNSDRCFVVTAATKEVRLLE